MIPLSLNEIASACNGHLSVELDELYIEHISIDSRSLPPGALFIAIGGDQFDGHEFLTQSIEAGAAAIMVSSESAVPKDCNVPVILVANTIVAMGQLAAFVRAQSSATVIAITGSNGKTTIKDMLAHLLAADNNILAAPKSFNNNIGVPLTIFESTGSEDYLILELGANHHGEIAELAAICKPDMAIISCVGRAHLEEFKDLAGVARAKAEILPALPEHATFVTNSDDPYCREMLTEVSGDCKTVLVGFDKADLQGSDLSFHAGGMSFLVNGSSLFQIPILGRHNVYNALLATAVALRCRMDIDEIGKLFQSFHLPQMRLALEHHDGMTFINDAYNANPESMLAALQTLVDYADGRHTVAVLGDMLELGEASSEAHAEIGRAVAKLELDLLIAIGQYAEDICQTAGSVSSHPVASKAEALSILQNELRADSVILLKGSRLMSLETLLENL